MALAEVLVIEPRLRPVTRLPAARASQERSARKTSDRGEWLDACALYFSCYQERGYSPGELAHYETGAQPDATGRSETLEPWAQTGDTPVISCTFSPCCCAVRFPP